MAQRFADLANEFMEKVRNTDLAGLGSIPGVFESERGFRTRSQFHFLEMENIAAPASPLRYLADATLGTFGAYGSIVAEAREFLNHLLETNSSRVQSDVDNRVAESRKRLESEVRSALEEVIGVAERALSNARAVQASGAEGTEAAHRDLTPSTTNSERVSIDARLNLRRIKQNRTAVLRIWGGGWRRWRGV